MVTKKKKIRSLRSAFTMIEMMVVVAIIGILMAVLFRLVNAVGAKNKEAVTVARLERLQNALSGFYAEYGSYPPVKQYNYPDPEKQRNDDDHTQVDSISLSSDSANMAARSQPVSYEFPPLESLDDFIYVKYQGEAESAGQVLTHGGGFKGDSDWFNVPIFKMGLLAYLLPRACIAWGASNSERYWELFRSDQWTDQTGGSSSSEAVIAKQVEAQQALEMRTVARWLPNFEKSICHGTTVMDVDLAEPNSYLEFVLYKSKNGKSYAVQTMTIRDGWNNELYYYSAPPYQSYRVWSSGPDGKTFPPWIPIDAKSSYKTAAEWVADDIVRSDH